MLRLKRYVVFGGLLLNISVADVVAVPVGLDKPIDEYNDVLGSEELTKYSRDLFGSVISAVRKGDRQKAALLIRRVLSAYPEHPVAWEFDGTLKLVEKDYKNAERSLIKSLTFMPERASPRAKLGLIRLAQNNIQEAKKLFVEALTQEPDNWIAHRYLARIARAEGDMSLALKHYSSLTDSGRKFSESVYLNYAMALAELNRFDDIINLLEPLTTKSSQISLLLAESYMSLGQLTEARQQLSRVQRNNPDDPRLKLLTAIDKRISGQYQESVNQLDTLIAENSSNPLYHYHFGLASLKLGQTDKALQSFQTALRNSQQGSFLRALLAAEFEQLEQTNSVIEALEPIAASKARKDVSYRLVHAYAKTGDWQKGLEHVDLMIQNYPQFVPAHMLKVEVFRGLGDLKKAERYALQTVTRFPASSDALKTYLRLLTSEYGQQKALKSIQQLSDNQPNNTRLAFMLANQYQSAEQYEQAERIYRQLLKKNPDNPGFLNNLAVVLSYQPEKINDALKYSRKASKLAPESELLMDTYGWILHLSGQSDQALTQLKKALDKQPDLKEAQCHLGLVQASIGRKQSDLLNACLNSELDQGLKKKAELALAN
ncbi:MAG: tetratricopeptide repeat protein [Gammaproteobacteria bacterium]|nr:tetratricopeptide repeat protein [Gammaproteobacteria bacterium]